MRIISNKHRLRWPIDQAPIPVKFKEIKPITHPEISEYSQLPEDQKDTLLNIKNIIKSYFPESKIYLFGSRVNGNWDENSDYDLVVETKIDQDKVNLVKNYDYGIKVDIFFIENYQSKNKVEI